MKVAFFRCLTCSHTVQVEIDRGKIEEPGRCPRDVCASVGTMSLIHNRCEFADRQVIRLQETPDAVPDGQTPHTVSLSAYDELVDLAKPGDRLSVTGIFRSVPVRVNPRQRTMKSLFKTYLDVVHIQVEDAIGGVQTRMIRKAELEAKLIELSRRRDLYELLARSLAPSIWEMEDVKKGILLQLFGGTNKNIARGGGGGGPRYRGDINVLLVGDPGTSKSQILQVISILVLSVQGAETLIVCAQNCSSRSVCVRKRFLSRWSHCVRYSRSRLETIGFREASLHRYIPFLRG